jgi:hypothetical protein
MADDEDVRSIRERFSPIKLGSEEVVKVSVMRMQSSERKKLEKEQKLKEKQEQERLVQRQQEQAYDRLLLGARSMFFNDEDGDGDGDAVNLAKMAEVEEEEEREENSLLESVCISPPTVTVGVAARTGAATSNNAGQATMLAMFASSPDPQESVGRISFSPGSTTPFYGRTVDEPPGAVLDYGFGIEENQLSASPPRGDDLDSCEGAGVRSTPMSDLTDYFTPPLTESPALQIPLLLAPTPPLPVHAPPRYKRSDTTLVILGDEENEEAEKKLELFRAFLAKLTLSQGVSVKHGDGKLEAIMSRHRELVAKGIFA